MLEFGIPLTYYIIQIKGVLFYRHQDVPAYPAYIWMDTYRCDVTIIGYILKWLVMAHHMSFNIYFYIVPWFYTLYTANAGVIFCHKT